MVESEGPAARWFNDAAFRGMQEGFAEASRSLGTALGEWLPKQLDQDVLEGRRVEGSGFGTGKLDRACLPAGLERDAACSGFACHFEASAFMEGCLEAATQTEALCEDGLDPDDIAATVPWRVGGCAGAGRSDNFCRHLLSRVQAHCHSKPSAAGA